MRAQDGIFAAPIVHSCLKSVDRFRRSQSVCPAPTSPKKSKRETTMRKIFFTVVGAALIASSMSQVAFSKEHHHAYNGRQFNAEKFRNSNAYAAPSHVPD